VKNNFCNFLILMLVLPIVINAQNEWLISAAPVEAQPYYGITAANGMIGLISSPNPFEVKEVVLAGAYDLYGRGRVSNFLKSFNLLNAQIAIDGSQIQKTNIQELNQSLDMRNGSFTTTFKHGNKAKISYTYYALRNMPFTVLMNISIEALSDIEISAASKMEAPDALRDVQNYYNEIDRPHTTISLLTSSAKSPTAKLDMCASNSFIFKELHGHEPRIIHEMWDNAMHLMKFSKKIKAGEQYEFSIVGSSITSAHHSDPLNEAERLTIIAKLEGAERLVLKHNLAWNKLWESDIEIYGDKEAQKEVRSMLYHLYSFVRAESPYSISPMGLSGLGYNGHVFWDTELWMYPALLVMNSELAKPLINYRFDRLEMAKKNAFTKGYRGAMFPWESADSGAEETPVWALSGPFEHHITACVGIAAWNYFTVSKDTTWLKEKGWPLLEQTAEFWASRVERKGPTQYEINNVVAADEWAENVNNNAFTNAAAITNLQFAAKAAKILKIPANKDWALVAANIPIYKMENGVTREHDSYKGEPIKQADVNLLAYPLKIVSEPAQILKDLDYYSTRVPDEGTPAMTQSVFSLLYARLGDQTKAYKFFLEAFQPNLLPPFNVIAETKGGTNPYFATGAGGVLQAVLMGFGGLEITDDGIKQIQSVLPKHWEKLVLKGIGPDKKTYTIKNN
jgi:trehalose/maltose hydrolase-like predicted phosphorylase